MPKVPSSRQKARTPAIPYAKGFHPPSSKEQAEAIGFTLKNVPSEYSDVSEKEQKFFCSVPQPKSEDDWLAQYVEEGQSFRDYKQENPWFSRRKQKYLTQRFVPSGNTICEKYPEGKIYIAKVGDFNQSDVKFQDLLDYVQRFLCMPVAVLEGITIERKGNDLVFVEDPASNPSSRSSARIKRSSLESRYNDKGDHIQISVDSILPKMRQIIPHDALCLIGLTPYDLYGDETDLFVAGMASGSQRVAVFSLLRYNPALTFSTEFWYDISESKSVTPSKKRRLLLQRSCKLLVHELCHLLGVDHCIFYRCCMNGSGHLQEDFDQPMMLCPVDLHKLQDLIGFNVLDRYRSLLEFYQTHDLAEEANWTKKRIHFIEKSRD
ncbi:archaemetzincin-2 [Aplysia californica]|uniref:Archaemetzincin-2 n=1 Tax=Aplysia californica TaxID=6500 RepID=A0ABM0K4H0_APLCA|nr:archaemetzincin-2 [Aplysia californica]XP_005108534.1 archaemetzincin-2 [Aplysia californica]